MEHSAGDLSQQTQETINSLLASVCGHPIGSLSHATEQTATDLVVTLICAVVVAFHAWDRYNTPETNRISTTRSLFLFTGAGYVSALLTLYLLLSEVALKPGVWLFLGLEGPKKILADYTSPPVLAAVLLTVLLPNTPIVSSADRWLLERFRTWGRIPHGVRNLAHELDPQALHLTPADVNGLQEWIAAQGAVPDELAGIVSVEAPETARGSLTRVLRLYVELQKLEAASSYRIAFHSQQDAWLAIKEDFRVFLAESQAFFVLFEKLTLLEGSVGEAALAKSKKCYRDICRKMHHDTTEFLAQLLLMVEGSDQRIGNRLQAIGFAPLARPGPHMQVGPFLFIGAMMIFGMLGVVAVLSPQHTHVLPPAVSAVLIGTTRTIGILAAILPKMRWSKCRPDERGNPPYLAWLGWAALAGIISLLIERAAYAIALGDAGAALDFAHYPLLPMAPMAFATSLVISILCDVDLGLGQGWARRFSEALLSGAASAVAMFVCVHLLDIAPSTAGHGPPWLPLLITFALGFGTGLFAPYFYRLARDEEPRDQLTPIHTFPEGGKPA
jgi:hypothetical protein